MTQSQCVCVCLSFAPNSSAMSCRTLNVMRMGAHVSAEGNPISFCVTVRSDTLLHTECSIICTHQIHVEIHEIFDTVNRSDCKYFMYVLPCVLPFLHFSLVFRWLPLLAVQVQIQSRVHINDLSRLVSCFFFTYLFWYVVLLPCLPSALRAHSHFDQVSSKWLFFYYKSLVMLPELWMLAL